MQAGKVCATHPGRGALLRDTEKPWGRGSKVRRQSPPAASTTHNSRHAERLADSALRARALPAASSRLPGGPVVPGALGRRRLALVELRGAVELLYPRASAVSHSPLC